MRSTHILVFVLCFGVANAQFSGLISGFLSGIIEGTIKGVVGAYAPLVKDGMMMLYNLVQTEIRVTLDVIDKLMKAAPSLMNTVSNTVSGVVQTGSNMFKGFTGTSKLAMQHLATASQYGLTGTFASFGAMNKKDQVAVAGTLGNVNRVFVAVTKLRMDSLKNADKEVPLVREIMEKDHGSPQALFSAFSSKAPKLTEFAKTAFGRAAAEFSASKMKLGPSAQSGLTMMQDSIRLSQKGVGGLLSSMTADVKKELGPLFNMMNNMVHVTNAVF